VWRPFEITFLDQQLVNGATVEEALAALTQAD
jgi:hypothetical protein